MNDIEAAIRAELAPFQEAGDANGNIYLTGPIDGRQWVATQDWIVPASRLNLALRAANGSSGVSFWPPGVYEVTPSKLVRQGDEGHDLNGRIGDALEVADKMCFAPLTRVMINGAPRTVRFGGEDCLVFETSSEEAVVVDPVYAAVASVERAPSLFTDKDLILVVVRDGGTMMGVVVAKYPAKVAHLL